MPQNEQHDYSPPKAFDYTAQEILAASYPDNPATLTHMLCDHPLLTLTALAELAARLPHDSIEYNRGDLPLGIRQEDLPANGLNVSETIRTIERNKSWAVLKNVEREAHYSDLLDTALEDIRPAIEVRTGKMLHREAFIFISSPRSVTPFHMDPEHNILLQIRGEKTMTIFPAADVETVPPEQSEAFARGGNRNLVWDDRFLDRGMAVHLVAGDAVLVPVKAPHFVQNGDAVSVSLSVTWRSVRSIAEGELHSLNATLRARSLPLVRVDRRPEKQWIGRAFYRIVSRLGWVA